MTTQSTIQVCEALGLTEPALRHLLRQRGAPRPQRHPTAGIYLWEPDDVEAFRTWMAQRRAPQAAVA